MRRETAQRRAIEKVFTRLERPLCITEIMEHGREMVGTLNQATV